MRLLQGAVRSDRAQLRVPRLAIALLALTLFGATPTPHPIATTFKQTIKPPPLPTVALHAAYTVETNKEGQVVRVRSVDPSKNPGFDAITYGNTLQAFIRRPDGTAVAGVYKLIYDYSPKTKKIRRDVQLVQAGGVNPDAPGAVFVELQKDAERQAAEKQKEKAHATSSPARLPDFNQIVTPPPKP